MNDGGHRNDRGDPYESLAGCRFVLEDILIVDSCMGCLMIQML